VSAPAHSLPAGSPPTLGSHGVLGSVGPSHVGVSALRYPSGHADPLDIGGQMSTSSATSRSRNTCRARTIAPRQHYFAAAVGYRRRRTAAARRSFNSTNLERVCLPIEKPTRSIISTKMAKDFCARRKSYDRPISETDLSLEKKPRMLFL